MGSRGNVSHIVTYDKKAASSQRVLVALTNTTKPLQCRNLWKKSSIITKSAGKFGSLPNHKGCQCNTMESKAGQSHCTCHQMGVLDIAYLTIHLDDGLLAFTGKKFTAKTRHTHVSTCCWDLPPRHFGERSQNTQHNIVRWLAHYSLITLTA